MAGAPIITVFVRHSDGCKYAGDEFSRRCNCRKHFRWTQGGVQHRRQAGTRSWEQAEEIKRQLQDQLAGRTPESRPEDSVRTLQEAIRIFLDDKKVQGVTVGVLGKYTRELDRLRAYCERQGVFTVQAITREMLTGFCATWNEAYPSSYTRAKVRERLRSFLRYGFEAKWLERIPALPKIKIEESPTLPLSAREYKRLLDAVYGQIADRAQADRVHALFQLMRHSGLAIRDALTLERKEIQHDAARRVYRIVTARQKTGTHVSVPIPPDVAKELLAVTNGNERYVFWSGEGEEESITKNWAKYYIAPVFKAARLAGEGHMMSHRLRDTFAVGLLEKGVPLEEVSKLLGHRSIKTTEKHYAAWIKGRQDRLDSVVMGTWAKRHGRRERNSRNPRRAMSPARVRQSNPRSESQ
jgi:integrase/recombinase XerD